jgi:hypothetical protein
MASIRRIRQMNLETLVARARGQKALADLIGKDKNQIYQWLLPEDAEGARGIGHKSARLLEAAFGLPEGWLDVESGSTSQPVSINRKTLGNALRIAAAFVEIMGLPPEKALDPEILGSAYDVAAADRAGDESLLGSTKKLAAVIREREGEADDERGKSATVGNTNGKAGKTGTRTARS